MSSKLVTAYLCVEKMDRAIEFWENFLDKKVVSRFQDRWADFGIKDGINIGLYRPGFDNWEARLGDNVVLNFKTDDIQTEYARVKKLNPKNISKIQFINFMLPYHFFQVVDTEGNTFEIAQWEDKGNSK
ncbi:MAG TPA: VOC family protein [Bacteriovoracaceae bacterium]|nr:VOC family protein [Bacteriovoracaceae bacterium]